MLLIGMLDSPFVRRVAVSMRLLGMPFEHANWSVGADLERIRAYSPLGRVPALVLDDGVTLTDSTAILDWLDDVAGSGRALLPAQGIARREALQVVALAIGAAEKGRELVYERAFRPPEKYHQPWTARCSAQMHGALATLERWRDAHRSPWMCGERISQADISLCCCWTFLAESAGLDAAPYPQLAQLVAACEAMPEFAGARLAWQAPRS